MELLRGKAAIVTGASRGIGLGIACALAREGADLVVHATGRSTWSRSVHRRSAGGCAA